MELRQLEAFVSVVSLGSFSRAAEKLYLTQPTISAHISALEKELGTQLIVRAPKEAYPSEKGKLLYEYALEMLALRDSAVAACKSLPADMSGSVRIAASTIPHQHVLPKLMSDFRQKHPGARFNILSCDSGGVVSSILAGKAEIGMVGSVMEAGGCVYDQFMEDELVVITPNTPQYQQMEEAGFHLEDLAKQPFIIREPGSGTRKEMEAYLQKKGFRPDALNIAAQMDDPDAIKNAVSQGLGVSIVSQLSAGDYQRFGLIRVFALEGEPILRSLYLVRHKSRRLSPISAAFARFVLGR